MSARTGGPGRQSPRGPRLSDKELFDSIDPLARGLAVVRVAASRGEFGAARQALASYLRSRTTVSWLFDRGRQDGISNHARQVADDVVAGRVVVIGIPHTFAGGAIDWFFNPTLVDEAYAPNHEWQWQLGRMSFWNDLAGAYVATRDEKYARAFAAHLRSWVASCRRPEAVQNSPGSAWRTIECGIRMSGSWPNAYYGFLKSPSFTDDDIILFLKSSIEHARYLRTYPTSGNWLTMEMNGLYTVGGLFPELREAAEWRMFASRRLHEELRLQFLPDGAQIELTPGYHQVALHNALAIYDKAAVFGRLGELASDYVARAEKPFEYNLTLMTPDRNLPRLNDSWHCDVPRSMRKALSFFPERADFRWVSTDGREGTPPQWTSRALDRAGYLVMRSGWERDATYLCFDVGPLGYGHVHQDKLNVVLWAFGRELLYDAGGGPYEQSAWRRYDTDTYSHNTILVDGGPQRRQTRDRRANVSRRPVEATWRSTKVFDFAAASYTEGYGAEGARPAAHHRRVLFLKPDLFVVADTLVPSDKATHEYQARWHLLTTSTTRDTLTEGIVTFDAGVPNLAVVPLLVEGLEIRTASGVREPELLGWFVGKREGATPATTVLHGRTGKGVQRFLTLLAPLRHRMPCPALDVRRTGEAAVEVALVDGRTLLVDAGVDPLAMIRAVETRKDGRPGRVAE